jgi:hypothetical protein
MIDRRVAHPSSSYNNQSSDLPASKHALSFLLCQRCNTNLLQCGVPRPTQNCAAGCSTALNQPTTASERPPAVSPLRMHGSCRATH